MQKFEHYLLTKFNKGLYTQSQKTKGDRKARDEWMVHRIRLFEKYCFPSIKSQVNQDFKWIVIFDRKTPKEFLRKIEEYTQYKNFIPVFDGSFDHHIKKLLRPETQYLITTRIDNDDAFHKNAIKKIQLHFAKDNLAYARDFFLNFPIGYCLDEQTGQITLNGSKSNPFITLVEKVKRGPKAVSIKTVRCMNHSHLDRLGKIKQICTTTPMWVQVIHKRNISNRVRGNPIPKEQFRRKDFGF